MAPPPNENVHTTIVQTWQVEQNKHIKTTMFIPEREREGNHHSCFPSLKIQSTTTTKSPIHPQDTMSTCQIQSLQIWGDAPVNSDAQRYKTSHHLNCFWPGLYDFCPCQAPFLWWKNVKNIIFTEDKLKALHFKVNMAWKHLPGMSGCFLVCIAIWTFMMRRIFAGQGELIT